MYITGRLAAGQLLFHTSGDWLAEHFILYDAAALNGQAAAGLHFRLRRIWTVVGKKDVKAVNAETEKTPVDPLKEEMAAPEAKESSAAEKKPAAKKTAAKSAPKKAGAAQKKEAAAKTAEKKPASKKAAAPKATVHVQFDGKDILAKDVLDQAVKAFKKSHRGVEVKTIELYIVANEGAAYYVVNGEGGDDFKIML